MDEKQTNCYCVAIEAACDTDEHAVHIPWKVKAKDPTFVRNGRPFQDAALGTASQPSASLYL